jgi:hypothetical protein
MGWFITCLVSFAVLFAMLPANNGNIPGVYIAALYSATSRIIWALSLAWITFACITGNGGPVNTFLSAKVWIPLSRLTHCAYLVHPIVMAVLYGSREQALDFSCYLLVIIHSLKHLIINCNPIADILHVKPYNHIICRLSGPITVSGVAVPKHIQVVDEKEANAHLAQTYHVHHLNNRQIT